MSIFHDLYIRFNPGFAARNAVANRQAQRNAIERLEKGDVTGWKFYGNYANSGGFPVIDYAAIGGNIALRIGEEFHAVNGGWERRAKEFYKCSHCRSDFTPDSRGNCSSCGAPK